MMHTMENIQQYMPMFQQFMTSMSGDGDLDGMFQSDNNMMDMLKNLMSEEQQAMFSMFMNENT